MYHIVNNDGDSRLNCGLDKTETEAQVRVENPHQQGTSSMGAPGIELDGQLRLHRTVQDWSGFLLAGTVPDGLSKTSLAFQI
jgi:hypothetical protein